MKTICIVGALDTKGKEFQYLKNLIEEEGFGTLVVNTGILGEPYFKPDISSDEVAEVGGIKRSELIEKRDPSLGVGTMGKGAKAIVKRLYDEGKIQGIVGLGGGQGTFMGLSAMSDLPLGFPKVLSSTIASVAPPGVLIGLNDTFLADPIVDVSGLNSILRKSIQNAAGAICGMVRKLKPEKETDKICIAVTMFGVTTKCVEALRDYLEPKGYEVQVFHSTGLGGAFMEKLVREGKIDAVIDLTTAEVSQRYTGGGVAGIETRMEAAGDIGIPQIVSVGGMDVINCTEALLAKWKDNPNRVFHKHNPTLTLMRCNKEELIEIAKIMAAKLNKAKGPTVVILPLKGTSAYDKEEMFFYDPEADAALFKALKDNLSPNIKVIEMDNHINDKEFAIKIGELIVDMIKNK